MPAVVAGVVLTESKSWRTTSTGIWPAVVEAPTSCSQLANAIAARLRRGVALQRLVDEAGRAESVWLWSTFHAAVWENGFGPVLSRRCSVLFVSHT